MAEKKITVRKIIELSERTLEGGLSLEELHESWPSPPSKGFFAKVFESLEDGIEHTPGYWLRPGINMKAWKKMPMYKSIEQKIDFLRS